MTTHIATRTSYSRLSTWLNCPRKFRLRYVDDAAEEVTPVSLIFGTAIHEACETFFNALKARQAPVDDVIYGAFQRALTDSVKLSEEMNVPVDWGKTSHAEMLAKGEAMIATFLAEVDRSIRVVATEFEFQFEIAPERLVDGVIDLILDEGNDRYRVIDIKTAASTYSPDRIENDLQPTLYIAAVENLLAAPGRVDFEYWVLLKTKQPQFKILPAVRDASDRAELIETIDDIETARSHGVFPRIRSFMCSGCEYAKCCRGARRSS